MSSGKMKTLGRTLGKDNSTFNQLLSNAEGEQTFVLKSGKKATFKLQIIPHADIEKLTFVDQAINGRDQGLLTPESVKDISSTIATQQFYPAIGRYVDGRIEVLDGSRRRAACLYSNADFKIMVTSDEISLADARQLAKDLRTAKEHSLRELGKRLELSYEGITKDEIARIEGLSQAKVTRAFQAAAVPDALISLFFDASELSLKDYQLLLQLSEEIQAKDTSIAEVAEKVKSIIGQESEPVEKAKILALLRSECRALTPKPQSKAVVTEKLRDFDDKQQSAKKKTNAAKRQVTYEFSRLSAAMLKELDKAIKQVLEAN